MAQLLNEHPVGALDSVSIVCLSHQKYAEVETSFVRRHLRELDNFWSIKKTDTGFHKLTFNNNYENPLILVQGWNKFREWHDLPENVEIEMMYYGNKIFEVFSIRDLSLGPHIPSFHSRSIHPLGTAYFDIEMTHVNIDYPELAIPLDFAEFIDKFHFESLLLCGDDGRSFRIRVLKKHILDAMKLGYTWDDFSSSQNFKVEDLIRFKFARTSNNASNRCHVYRLS